MKYCLKKITEVKPLNLDEVENNKKKIIEHFHSSSRIKQALVGEAILKDLLEKQKIKYDISGFYKDMNGKRYLMENKIYFNISHSYEFVLVATSKHKIGVDVEKIRKVNFNTVSVFATENEKKYIFSLKTEIEKRLFQIYCLKEAYFKMKGIIPNNYKEIEFFIQKDNYVTCSDSTISAKLLNNMKDYVAVIIEKVLN